MWISGFSGGSYGAEMPVKSEDAKSQTVEHRKQGRYIPLISPARAFLYRPFGSRCSATCSGASTKTSTKPSPAFSCSSRAPVRSARYGEMKAVMEMAHASANSFDTCGDAHEHKRTPTRRANEEDRPRLCAGCSRSATSRRSRGPCSAQIARCRRPAGTRTSVGGASAARVRMRLLTAKEENCVSASQKRFGGTESVPFRSR